MSLIPVLFNLFSAMAFLLYGTACLFTESMKKEFVRFRLSSFRTLIGVTQILAAAALFSGFRFPLLGLAGAAGLTVQMVAGLAVRWRIGDGWRASLQALVFACINSYLTFFYFSIL